jgi:hypothetical protein
MMGLYVCLGVVIVGVVATVGLAWALARAADKADEVMRID